VVVTTKTSLPKMAAIYASTSLETLKAWEAFHTRTPRHLTFHPFVKAPSGFPLAPALEENRDYDQRSAVAAVGKMDVVLYFPPETKTQLKKSNPVAT
jgi:hypothetical protein